MEKTLLEEITSCLKVCLQNRAEEIALKNLLYSKIAHLFALKNITFESCNNLCKPALLSHYAINFINSGGRKNEAISHIDNFVMPFIELEYDKINKEVVDIELDRELSEISPESKNYEREKKTIVKSLTENPIMSYKTNGGTFAGLYDKLEKISKYKKGAIIAQITEFADYFKTSVENVTSSNSIFLDLIKNLYDGKLEVSDSLGTKRRELNNIPFSVLFLSDIEDLLEPKSNKGFKIRLKNGLARRSYFYINKDINYDKNPPARPTIEEKKVAYNKLSFLSERLKNIYYGLPFGAKFEFSPEANQLIYDWEGVCEEEKKGFYKYTDVLTLDDTIKKIELEHSTWKIIKLAVIIQILKNEHTFLVGVDAVQEAIDFYLICRKSLYSILAEKQITEEENLLNFFLNNQNIDFNRTAIKRQNFVSRDQFPRWFQTALSEVAGMLEEKGFELVCTKKSRNEYKYCCKKLVSAEEKKINLSVSNHKAEHPVEDYESLTVDTEQLIDLIKNAKALSAGQFKNGYRNDENKIGEQNTIWLDFDDGLTIEEAKEKFKKYWYVIYTSVHHQKKKDNKVACDRFRVILKTKYNMPCERDHYKNVMQNIIAKLKADKQCCDFSRYYKGNSKAIIFTNNGDYFDWSDYDNFEEKQTFSYSATKPMLESVDHTNGLNDETIFTEKGDSILKASEIYQGNRDGSLKYTVGVLISAVQNNNLSHRNALKWLENKLNEVTTPDFKQNARKYMKRLRDLKF